MQGLVSSQPRMTLGMGAVNPVYPVTILRSSKTLFLRLDVASGELSKPCK